MLIARRVLGAGVLTMVLGAYTASEAAAIVDISVFTSLEKEQAYFSLLYKSQPDFVTTDEFLRGADEFNLYIDSDNALDATTDIGRFYQAAAGVYPRDGLHLVSRSARNDAPGEVSARGIAPFYEPGDFWWGPVAGSSAYAQDDSIDDSIVTFSVPLAWLDATDGTFWWAIKTVEYGGGGDSTIYGYASYGYASADSRTKVPEAGSTMLFLGMGLTMVAAGRQLLDRPAQSMRSTI